MSIADVIAWAPAIVSIIMVVIGIVKLVPELHNTDASAAKTYMEAAQAAAGELRESQKEARLELSEWKTTVTENNKTISELKDRIDALETDKRHLEEELATLKGRVAMLENDKLRLEKENSIQLARIAALEEEKRQQQQTIERLTRRVAQLEAQVVSLGGTPIPNGGTGPLAAK